MIDFAENYSIPPAHSVVILQGGSGQVHGFTAFPMAAPVKGAGICIFVRPPEDSAADVPSYWDPIYACASGEMGENGDLPRSIVERARRMGATHMLVHFCDRGEDARLAIAEDVIVALRPLLNGEGYRAAA
jgi:hypothetical protein